MNRLTNSEAKATQADFNLKRGIGQQLLSKFATNNHTCLMREIDREIPLAGGIKSAPIIAQMTTIGRFWDFQIRLIIDIFSHFYEVAS